MKLLKFIPRLLAATLLITIAFLIWQLWPNSVLWKVSDEFPLAIDDTRQLLITKPSNNPSVNECEIHFRELKSGAHCFTKKLKMNVDAVDPRFKMQTEWILAVSPDLCHVVAMESAQLQLQVFNLESGSLLFQLPIPKREERYGIDLAGFSRDGNYFFACLGPYPKILRWKFPSGQFVKEYSVPVDFRIRDALMQFNAFSPYFQLSDDHQYFSLSSHNDNQMLFYESSKTNPIGRLENISLSRFLEHSHDLLVVPHHHFPVFMPESIGPRWMRIHDGKLEELSRSCQPGPYH